MPKWPLLVIIVCLLALLGFLINGLPPLCSQGNTEDQPPGADKPDNCSPEQLKKIIKVLEHLHKKMGKPQPGDWLDQHEEEGQTFTEYLASDPVLPRGKRNIIYIQPLGEFSGTQRKIIDLTREYMATYFGVTVKVEKKLPLSIIPKEARRVHPSWGVKQILSTYVLHSVLQPRLPEDAAAMIAFTTSDLWPGRGWNFVFGQASLRERVGVWSVYRNGDPDESDDSFKLCLVRTLKTAVHETGHMFGQLHCIQYECCM
ncbi:archaemetzincin, partial [Planctomycetota bacterium]